MKFEQIKELIKILVDSNLHEISYKEGENKIELKKAPAFEAIPNQFTPRSQPHAQTDAKRDAEIDENSATKTKQEPSNTLQTKETKEDPNIFHVESPLVGTFYQSSNPDEEPFVKVGSKVKKGDPLCIVEAMKIMNIIEAEVDGTIEKIYIENAHFVEYKSRIFRIRKP